MHPVARNHHLSRPRTGRSKVCGTSATRPGKCAVISGGGAGSVVAAGQTTTAPFSRIVSAVTLGARAGSIAWHDYRGANL